MSSPWHCLTNLTINKQQQAAHKTQGRAGPTLAPVCPRSLVPFLDNNLDHIAHMMVNWSLLEARILICFCCGSRECVNHIKLPNSLRTCAPISELPSIKVPCFK